MPKTIIIYNPLAGASDFVKVVEDVAGDWRTIGWDVTVKPTREAGHATIIATEAAASDCDLVIAAGGDGTLGEVVNGLAESDTIMGVLPAGTANSFAREMHMPVPGALQVPMSKSKKGSKLQHASAALMAGQVYDMDLGYRSMPDRLDIPGRYWMLWAGTGADGFLVNEVEPRSKWSKKFGWSSYVLQGISALSNFSHIKARVEVDGISLEDDYIMVLISNSRRYAGGVITLSQEACLDDGLFEIWLFGGRGFSGISAHGLRVLRGQHLENPDTMLLQGQKVKIFTDPPMPVQMDGDPSQVTPLECEVKSGALRLLVPDSAPADLFQNPGISLEKAIQINGSED